MHRRLSVLGLGGRQHVGHVAQEEVRDPCRLPCVPLDLSCVLIPLTYLRPKLTGHNFAFACSVVVDVRRDASAAGLHSCGTTSCSCCGSRVGGCPARRPRWRLETRVRAPALHLSLSRRCSSEYSRCLLFNARAPFFELLLFGRPLILEDNLYEKQD